MRTTFNVRIWKTKVYRGSRTTTYYVRWVVNGHEFKEPYRTSALAESFRSQLVAAAKSGEAFYVSTGLPLSMERATQKMTWYELACDYIDAKWLRSAATTRRTLADAVTAATCEMFTTDRGMPAGQHLRSALKRWAFNTKRRDDPDPPAWVTEALRWASRNTRPASALADPRVLREVLEGMATKLDGTPRSTSVMSRWRKIVSNMAEYAVERGVLTANPVPALKWKPTRAVHTIDRRRVANPNRARALLEAVREQGITGQRLETFFGCLYYAGLRPEEAAGITIDNLNLPAKGWGEIHLGRAKPHAGSEWTDSGDERDDRPLKQREFDDVRTAPSPPQLTALLHQHVKTFGTADDGRLFVGERSKTHLPTLTVTRTWARARQAVFGERAAQSPLAARPYDLRHAAVSTWLNAGVPATQVAEWAGHSVEVLLSIYAKCIDGDAQRHRSKIDQALRLSLG